MTPFERKIVHDAVAAVPGVHSESEGVEPSRRVVVLLRLASYSRVVRGVEAHRGARQSRGCFT